MYADWPRGAARNAIYAQLSSAYAEQQWTAWLASSDGVLQPAELHRKLLPHPALRRLVEWCFSEPIHPAHRDQVGQIRALALSLFRKINASTWKGKVYALRAGVASLRAPPVARHTPCFRCAELGVACVLCEGHKRCLSCVLLNLPYCGERDPSAIGAEVAGKRKRGWAGGDDDGDGCDNRKTIPRRRESERHDIDENEWMVDAFRRHMVDKERDPERKIEAKWLLHWLENRAGIVDRPSIPWRSGTCGV